MMRTHSILHSDALARRSAAGTPGFPDGSDNSFTSFCVRRDNPLSKKFILVGMTNHFRPVVGLGVAIFFVTVWVDGWAAKVESKPVDEVLSAAAGGAEVIRVTPQPQAMSAMVAVACAYASTSKGGPHDGFYFDVYLTPGGAETMRTARGAYPAGTVILKRKYSDAAGQKTVFFTGMRKHGAGYNPEGGDWEYFTTSGDGKKATSQEKLASCMACHEEYASTDYVTRDYDMRPEFLPNAPHP
jgi:Cytochrome P460